LGPSRGANAHLRIEFHDHGNQQMKATACGGRSGQAGFPMVIQRGTRIGSRQRYIRPVDMCAGVATWSLALAILPRRMAGRRKPDDGYLRETFSLPRDKARTKARDFLTRYPRAAYMSSVESWRELPGVRHSNSRCGGCAARTSIDDDSSVRPLAAHASRRSRRSLVSMRLLCFNKLDLIPA